VGHICERYGCKARNIACEITQGIFYRVSKDVVKAMGLNKTQKAIELPKQQLEFSFGGQVVSALAFHL
jgi:ribosomal protein S13